jgi:RecG-like helicase
MIKSTKIKKNTQRHKKREEIAEKDVIIGTHALLEEKVKMIDQSGLDDYIR